MNLVINRVRYKFDKTDDNMMVVSNVDNRLLFSMKFIHMSKKLNDQTFDEWGKSLSILSDDKIYYDFNKSIGEEHNAYRCKVNDYFIPKLIRRIILEELWKANLIVEPIGHIVDFCAYKRVNEYNAEWDVYERYDFKIHNKCNEVSISLGSEATLISKNEILCTEEYNNPKCVTSNRTIFPHIKSNPGEQCKVIANYAIKHQLGYSSPKKLKFNSKYQSILSFYSNYIKPINSKGITFISQGLNSVDFRKVYKVNILENKLIFKNDKVDINPITGMRDYGIYKDSPKAYSTQFIFIYENSSDANDLYRYLKNGYKNFPGLERYVGIPTTISDKKGFKYNNGELERTFKQFEQDNLPEGFYENIFAIVVGQFDKNNTSEERTDEYYNIKKALLQKGIASQFINQQHIRQASVFNYHLPNIAIGIVAKLGGVPWRLKNSVKKDLVIGFNQVRLKNKQYIGGSVFFTNEGRLESVYSYPSANSEIELIKSLKNSIETYIAENGEIHRLIIHYYKPNSNNEQQKIEDLIYKELKINIEYAIIEINDSKSQSDICFDMDYDMGMPISGTYVNIGCNEYLLFNNTRHIEKPISKVDDELPIKIKIHFANNSGFNHNELISQIYEFSRLIWKGLKQRSQPATTIYAKLIADFSAHFDGDIPSNEITQRTPWFI